MHSKKIDKSHTVFIRNLSPNQLTLLTSLMEKYGINASTKAFLFMLDNYQKKIDLIESQVTKIQELERDIELLKMHGKSLTDSVDFFKSC